MSDITIRPDEIGTPNVSIKVNVAGGMDGATFIPDVSEEGVLSWTNDAGLENPEPVKIKGKDGADVIDVTITGGAETDDDGPGSGGGTEVASNILTDTETGVRYRLYVVNGSLSMEEVSDAIAVTAAPAGDGLRLVDDATGATYKVFVSGGKLTMTEVE